MRGPAETSASAMSRVRAGARTDAKNRFLIDLCRYYA